MVFHTLLSSLRGLIYGFCFVVFEEKLFRNFFRKWFIKIEKDSKEIEREIINESRSSEKNEVKSMGDNEEKEESDKESKIEENNGSEYVELNTSQD